MGFITEITLGKPNGKIGDLVFYTLNGKSVCRRIGKKGPQSPLQLANCQRMAVTMKLLSPMVKFINFGYGIQAKGTDKNAHNLATAYHKKYALKGVYPNIKVDYSKVIISQGERSQITDVELKIVETGLQFNWDPKNKYKSEEYDDQVMIMVCYPKSKKADQYLNAARRSDGAHFIKMDPDALLEPIAVYMSLKSADGSQISDSMYLGTLNEQEEIHEITEEQQQEALAEKKIADLSTRFKHISHSYQQQQKEIKTGIRLENKAFRQLEVEYLALKSKLKLVPKDQDS